MAKNNPPGELPYDYESPVSSDDESDAPITGPYSIGGPPDPAQSAAFAVIHQAGGDLNQVYMQGSDIFIFPVNDTDD